MDYRKYRAGFGEKLACAAVGAGVAGLAAWLFYRSVWGMLLFPAAYLVCVKKYCALQKEKRKEQLLMEFKDAMRSASAALLAGYSVENAWREAEKELVELYGEKGLMAAEVRRMNETLSALCRRRYKNSRGGLKSKGKWQPRLPESGWRGGSWR